MNLGVFAGVLLACWLGLGLLRFLVMQPLGASPSAIGTTMAIGGIASYVAAYLVAKAQRRRTSISAGAPPNVRTGKSPSNIR